MKHRAFIALGSNIGDRQAYLQEAIAVLAQHPQIQLVNESAIYETEPIGYVEQDYFYNMVIEIKTSLTPEQLLDVTQEIEQSNDRVRDIRWGPRTIDLDILLYDNENIELKNLVIPHPRMWERAFVIVPLMELDRLIVRQDGKSIVDIYNELEDQQIKRLTK